MNARTETVDARLDRLEAMLVAVMDQLDRLSERLGQPLHLQERALKRVEEAVDDLRAQVRRRTPVLPPPTRFEPPAEEPS